MQTTSAASVYIAQILAQTMKEKSINFISFHPLPLKANIIFDIVPQQMCGSCGVQAAWLMNRMQ